MWQRFSHLLKKEGITLSKEAGQHLLLNPSLLSRICDVAELGKNDDVLEVGAGIGNLTSHIAKRARKVLAVEIDSKFQPLLERNLARFPNVVVLIKDFLKLEEEEIKRHLSFPFKIVSNIPFSITAQILQRIVDFKNNLSLVVITVQKEVADKLLPPPNRYASPLSLYITFHFKIERKFVINRRAFLPPPEVDARVIKMSPQPPPIPLEDEEEFFQFIRNIFKYKRKNIRNALKLSGYSVAQCPISLERRLESLSWEELKCLFLATKG
ncbi:MAG: 16S rRNA (adenine(1518)-N(6)/adenine(1519)-N(6))-dimethyltransferase RsmA [bacterium]